MKYRSQSLWLILSPLVFSGELRAAEPETKRTDVKPSAEEEKQSRLESLLKVVNSEKNEGGTRQKAIAEIAKTHFVKGTTLMDFGNLWARFRGLDAKEITPNLPLAGFLSFKLEESDQIIGMSFQLSKESEPFNVWLVIQNPYHSFKEAEIKEVLSGKCPSRLKAIKLRGVDVQKVSP